MTNNNKPQPIDVLAFELKKAKELEASAKEKRIECEERLIASVGCQEEGSTTHEGNYFKVTTTGKLSRKLDDKAWRAIAREFNGNYPVRTKLEIDTKKMRKLACDEPAMYQLFLTCVTTKPAKSSVRIEEVE